MQSHGRYSSNQLVFQVNVNLPYLESFTSSDIIRQNLNALHDQRKNFVKAESCERIKRALWHNVRTCCEENNQNGEKCFRKEEQ